MKKFTIIAVILMAANLLTGQIINIPGDYPSIQQGIDAANNGDTILVEPGTYVEHINYDGKNIVVGSLVITTQDTSYISQTIIQGNLAESVVTFENGEQLTALLCGFTITNGNAEKGGGIYCSNSSPTLKWLNINSNSTFSGHGGGLYFVSSDAYLENIIVANNIANAIGNMGAGGGIYMGGSDLTLIDVLIVGNLAGRGGGIYFGDNYSDEPSLQNVIIHNNKAGSQGGGGIFCNNSNPLLSNVTIVGNEAEIGGGIRCQTSGGPDFDDINRCNIYNNFATEGNDIYLSQPIQVLVDTFTVANPTAFHCLPLENFTFDIQNSKLTQIDDDLYVSPSGDNNNTGLSSDEALKTIHCALSKILPENTIHLADGLYSPSSNDEYFPISITSGINLMGNSTNGVIINPEETKTGIRIKNNPFSHISHMTITGGWEGIYCWYSYPLYLDNLIITGNNHGIYCYHSHPEIENVIISDNHAGSQNGGGIKCNSSVPKLKNVTITNNSANFGGGIYTGNNSGIIFYDNFRSNIFQNTAIHGNDLYSFLSSDIEVIVDTFTVLFPNNIHAEPIEKFTFDILHGTFDQIDEDLYVSPEGDNSNSGLNADEPLKNIRYALMILLADSLNPRTINLLEGTFSPGLNGEIFPIVLHDYVSLIGSHKTDVILDAEETGSVIYVNNNSSNVLSEITITGGSEGGIDVRYSNLKLQDVIINDNYGDYYGGGITGLYSNLELYNVDVTNNSTDVGGGIYFSSSIATLINVQISGNSASGITGFEVEGGGGMFCENTDPLLMNVSITNNSCNYGGGIHYKNSSPQLMNVLLADNGSYQGGGIYGENTDPLLVNVTFANNYAEQGGGLYGVDNSHFKLVNCIMYGGFFNQEIYLGHESGWGSDTISVSYSNIQNGETGIVTNDSTVVMWQEGNIDEDPLFVSAFEDYQLSPGSPCIDAGNPDTTGLNLPYTDILGNIRLWDGDGNGSVIIDMGAYEFGALPVEIKENIVRGSEFEVRSYPNPVSENCTLEFDMAKSARVSIHIYNNMGELLVEPKIQIYPVGQHQVNLNMVDQNNGIYFCRVQIGNERVTKKIIKL